MITVLNSASSIDYSQTAQRRVGVVMRFVYAALTLVEVPESADKSVPRSDAILHLAIHKSASHLPSRA